MRVGEEELRADENWLVGEKWDNMWQSFRHTAFRFETMPEYRVAQEREVIDQLKRGIVPPGYNQRWHDSLAKYRRQGKRVIRVRIIDSPITEYQRHQVDLSYPANVKAGEDIFIIPLLP